MYWKFFNDFCRAYQYIYVYKNVYANVLEVFQWGLLCVSIDMCMCMYMYWEGFNAFLPCISMHICVCIGI